MAFDCIARIVGNSSKHLSAIGRLHGEIESLPKENAKSNKSSIKKKENEIAEHISEIARCTAEKYSQSKIFFALTCEQSALKGYFDRYIEKNVFHDQNGFKLQSDSANKVDLYLLESIKKAMSPRRVKYPIYSMLISFRFRLLTPAITGTEDPFYPTENAVFKERLLKLPVINASTWKGNVRSAAMSFIANKVDDGNKAKALRTVFRLFGNEKEPESPFEQNMASIFSESLNEDYINEISDKEIHAGRMRFFPTFFDRTQFNIMNPHDRKTKSGTVPVSYECIRSGSEGRLWLLYLPFDLLGRPLEMRKAEVADDLGFLCQSLGYMFDKTGFSAKKSSGFGLATGCDVEGEGTALESLMIKETLIRRKFSSFLDMKGELADMLKISGEGQDVHC